MQLLYRLSEYYEAIIAHLVDTESEVELLNAIFRKHGVKSVLDVACGIGRHAIPLAKRGYDVVGIDYSRYQLKKARACAKREGVAVRFVLQDANEFSFPGRFDAAICMWTTLGEEPLRYRKVMRNVVSSLKPGGIFVIDNRSWEYIPKGRQETITNTVTTEKGTVIETTIRDRYTDTLRLRDVRYVIGGKRFDDRCVTHTLREKEWIWELKDAGFKRFKVYHDRGSRRVRRPRHVTIVAMT